VMDAPHRPKNRHFSLPPKYPAARRQDLAQPRKG